jgi:hypothetical protein
MSARTASTASARRPRTRIKSGSHEPADDVDDVDDDGGNALGVPSSRARRI